MINPQVIKDAVFNIVDATEGEIDLTKDTITMTFTYPEMPDILVTLSIGGLFYQEDDDEVIH
jgi:hypothetical protein